MCILSLERSIPHTSVLPPSKLIQIFESFPHLLLRMRVFCYNSRVPFAQYFHQVSDKYPQDLSNTCRVEKIPLLRNWIWEGNDGHECLGSTRSKFLESTKKASAQILLETSIVCNSTNHRHMFLSLLWLIWQKKSTLDTSKYNECTPQK